MEKCNARIVHGHQSGRPLLILYGRNGLAAMIELAKPLTKERAMTLMNGHSKTDVVVELSEAEAVEAEIDARMAAELQAKRDAMRLEIIGRMEREKTARRYDKINAHHPVEDPPSAEEQAAMNERFDRARAETAERLAAADERYRREEAEREAALSEARAKPRHQPRKYDENGFPL
jgi:hypothetical protein